MILEHSFEPPSNKHVVTQQPRSPPCDSPATRHAVPPASETPSRSDPWRLPTGTRDETKKSPNVPNNSWVWWCLWCYDWWALWWWWWWWWWWWGGGGGGWRRWRRQQKNKLLPSFNDSSCPHTEAHTCGLFEGDDVSCCDVEMRLCFLCLVPNGRERQYRKDICIGMHRNIMINIRTQCWVYMCFSHCCTTFLRALTVHTRIPCINFSLPKHSEWRAMQIYSDSE